MPPSQTNRDLLLFLNFESLPCNLSTPLEELKKEFGSDIEFPEDLFDSDDWLTKNGVHNHKTSNISARAEFMRQMILKVEEDEIVVVTHADFGHFLVKR